MSTPSETRAGKLPDDEERCESGDPECGPVEFHDSEGVPLCRVCWEGLLLDSAADGVDLPWTPARIQSVANRVRTNGDEEAAHLIELLNTAGIEAEEEALAASEPDMRDAYEGAREDLLDWKGRAQRAEARLRSLGWTGIDVSEPVEALVTVEVWEEFAGKSCYKLTQHDGFRSLPNGVHHLYTHPAPEQPGKGEALCWINPQSLRNFAAGKSTKEWAWAKPEAGDVPLTIATLQPSDPAEGDALGMFNLLLQRLRGQLADSTSDFAYVIVRDYANELGDIFNALSTPPTAAVNVDMDDLLFVGFDKNSEHRLFRMRKTAECHCIGDIKTYVALTAALDPQVKK